jgi:peptide/nickel transport system substrate-binding protein
MEGTHVSSSSYWSRYWRDRRSSRRRFIGSASALGAGAAGFALAGCGDDDDDDDGGSSDGNASPTSSGGNGASPSATAPSGGNGGGGEGIVGGTVRYPFMGLSTGDPPTLFPFENLTYLAQHTALPHYSRLVREVAGPDIPPGDYTALEGDATESWEQPDDLTYVFKWRPNLKWHDKEPMNGREATAEDFAQTYQAFLTLSQNAGVYEPVVTSMEATDPETLTVTLSEPFAPFLATHASSPEGVWFIPVETINNQQVQTDPVGTGPYIFREWESGVALRWDRNPDYYASPVPYYEKLEGSLNADPQRIIAALKSGDLDFSLLASSFYELAQSELDPAGTNYFEPAVAMGCFYFNFDNDGGRWRDKRLRQALSMAMDRAGYLSVLDQTGKGDWHSHIAVALEPFWVSPQSEEFGENFKYYQHNPEEAKALLQAATGSDTIDFVITANVDRYGASAQQSWELIASQLKQIGFNDELRFQEYSAYIQSTYLGDIAEGVGLGPLIGSPRDPNDQFSRNYESSSARHNWGGTPIDEQAEIDAMFAEQRQILDVEERVAKVHEILNFMADSMLAVPYTGSSGYGYANPYVQNFYPKAAYGVHRASYFESWFTQERIDRGP